MGPINVQIAPRRSFFCVWNVAVCQKLKLAKIFLTKKNTHKLLLLFGKLKKREESVHEERKKPKLLSTSEIFKIRRVWLKNRLLWWALNILSATSAQIFRFLWFMPSWVQIDCRLALLVEVFRSLTRPGPEDKHKKVLKYRGLQCLPRY